MCGWRVDCVLFGVGAYSISDLQYQETVRSATVSDHRRLIAPDLPGADVSYRRRDQ